MKHLKLFFALFAMLAFGVGNAWGESLQATLDFTTNSWGLPTSKVVDEQSFTSGAYTIKVKGSSGNGYNFNSSDKYLLMGKSGATLTLPAFDFTTTKIVITGKSGASGSVKQNIYVGSTEVSTATTGATGTNTYLINSSYQAAGNVYVLKVTSAYNTQITKIEIYGEAGGSTPPTPPTTTYTIKWHTAVGTTTDVTLNEGAAITKPATDPTMSGYEFMGWTDQCSVAEDGTGFTALTNFGTADSDKEFYAVFAVATTTGGGGSATETTAKVTVKDYASANSWANGTKYTSLKVDANITASVTGSSNTGKYYTSGNEWRIYQNENPTLTLTAAEGNTIKTAKVTYNINNTGVLKLNGANVTSGTASNINASSVTYNVGNTGSATNGQVKVTAIEVVYTSGSASVTTYSNYTTTCSGATVVETLTDAQFAWSAATAEATMGATNTFPTLTNTVPVSVTYESSNTAAATIAADGTITLVAPGTTTISAKFAGGEVSGTTYAAKTVTYALTVLKAPATPTENVYVKVTETAGITDGEYLIVYEDAEGNPKAPVAFDGSLATLDAAGNMMSVTITDNVINGNTEIDEVTFNISAMTGGYAIKSKSGKYIGRTSSGNGMNTGASEILNIITITDGKTTISGNGDGASTSLQYYSASGSERFRYYGSNQKPIALYKKVDPSEVLAPTFSVAAGSYYDAQSVVITCATPGAKIYYTLDGTDPTSSSTEYTSAITISETKTLKAIAINGEYSSSVSEVTYTILTPLATMQEIFDKATAVGNTATSVKVAMNNWVVTGVKGSNVYLTDGTKGLIIYTASHGFVVGDVLSGTVACKVQLYNGSSELTELTKTTEGLTVTTGGTVTPVVVNDVTTLSGVNTGSVIKITGVCEKKTINDKDYYYVANVQLYNSLFAYTNPTVGNKYNVTGVYLQYGDVEEILPRKKEDIEEVQDLATATISVSNISLEVDETKTIEATITPDAAKTKVQYAITKGSEYITLNGATITGVAEGTATIRATIANADGEYYGTTKDFTVTVTSKSTKDEVVILAELGGKWYAMKGAVPTGKSNQLDALEVTYLNGTLYNVAESDKASITWTRSVVDGKATFANNGKYLKGNTDTDLTLSASVDDKCKWIWDDEKGYYTTNTSGTIRTFIYRENFNFKNYDVNSAGKTHQDGNYSKLPVVTAPVYVNLNTASVKTIENAYFSVGDNKYVQFSTGNLQYEVGTNTWSFASKQYEVIGGEAYTGSNNTNYGMNVPGYTGKLDLFGWSSDGKFGVNPSNTDAHYGYAATDFVDWGKLVDETGWCTLTQPEMRHILNRTKDGEKLWALATVNGLNGLILLPDNWNTSISLVYGYVPTQFVYTENQLTISQWEALEAAGAVFLPAAGSRTGGYGNTETAGGKGSIDANGHYFHVDNVGDYGYYWLNTQDTRPAYPHCASFLILPGWDEGPTVDEEGLDDLSTHPQVWSREKRRGNSVRLVKEVTPDYTRDEQGAGVYGTVCYPENIVWCDGGTLYQVAGKEGNKVIFDEVTTPEAGMPYIFIADQEVLNFFCGTKYEATAGEYNSLQGTFTQIDPAERNALTDNYVLYNNIIKKCGANCGLNANRAYFIGDKLENLGSAPSPIQGRRRISLEVTNENTATGIDGIVVPEGETVKVIVNGQLIIIRNGEKFNAQGQRL